MKRKTIGNSKSNALLAGLLFDDQNNKLVPHHANKKGALYSYYVSQKLKTGDQDSGWRVPAQTLEQTVKDVLTSTLASKSDLLGLLPIDIPSADQMQHIVKTGKSIVEQIDNGDHLEVKTLLNTMVDRIELRADQIMITINAKHIAAEFGINLPEDASSILTKPMTIRRHGQEMKMVIGGEAAGTARPNDSLIKLIAKAHTLRSGLEDGSICSIKDFAKSQGIDHADAKRSLPLGYLAPDIVEAILAGHQPQDLSALMLKNGYKLPVTWTEQRSYLGFTSR